MTNPFPRPPTSPPPRRVNTDVVALLEQKLAEAKNGLLVGLGIVSVTQSPSGAVGIAAESRGEHGAFILAGAVELQNQVRNAMFPPATQALPLTTRGPSS